MSMKRLVGQGALDRNAGAGSIIPRSPVAALAAALGSGPVCFDTTIPLYFATRNLEGMLNQAFWGRAVTPWAVRAELEGLVHHDMMGPAAVALLRDNSLPRVIPADVELETDAARIVRQLDAMRRDLERQRGALIRPTADAGESAAIAICRRYAPQSMALLAQDGLAKRVAARYGIPILGSAHALLAICLAGYLRPDVAWVHYLEMGRRGLAHREFSLDPVGRRLFIATFEQMQALEG